ncbi:MAG: hypothetical protein ABSD75_03350 [Terriglobales bacterium]
MGRVNGTGTYIDDVDAGWRENTLAAAELPWLISFLSSVVSLATSRCIMGATAGMVVMIEELAVNNLSIDDLEITCQDELSRARSSTQRDEKKMRASVQSIADHAQHVASASEEFSATSLQIPLSSVATSPPLRRPS